MSHHGRMLEDELTVSRSTSEKERQKQQQKKEKLEQQQEKEKLKQQQEMEKQKRKQEKRRRNQPRRLPQNPEQAAGYGNVSKPGDQNSTSGSS